MLTNLSLFSGIGGIDLAAKWTAMVKTVAYVENDPYAQAVLLSRMRSKDLDDAPIFEDVRTFRGERLRGNIDIVSGGFPCQPYSRTGKKLGGADERNLWPEYLRIVREIRPRFVLAENVEGILDTYAGKVLVDLEEESYCVTPISITACEVGAPHMRSRVFFLAHAKGLSRSKTNPSTDKKGNLQRAWLEHICPSWVSMARIDWTIPSSWIFRDIDGIANRVDRTRCTGNAVVPQCAEKIWEKILNMEDNND